MGEDADRRLLLATARDEFLDHGTLAVGGVPEHVVASWRRSASLGVEPHSLAPEHHLEIDTESRLVRCAEPVIEQLSEQVADAPFCLALTDDKARILTRCDSNSWIGRMLDRVSFATGFDYAEGAVGTNGVGTVLEFGESVHIVGAEHFVDTLQTFACAGAPVRDPFTGRIAGVLDMSCLSDHSTPLMHSLVRSAARQIENNLLLDRDRSQQALFDAYSRVDARTRSAVIGVGARVVMANTAMQLMLDSGDHEAVLDHLRFVMARRESVDDRVDLPSGRRVRLRGATVRADLAVAGIVAVVSTMHEVDQQDPWEPRAPSRQGSADRSGVEFPGGSVPAWRLAVAGVEEALRANQPLLVLGESGAGRYTLVCEAARRLGRSGAIDALDAEEVEADPRGAARRLLAATPSDLVVLQDVDRLPAGAIRTLTEVLDAADSPLPMFAATGRELMAGQDLLLTLFKASVSVPALRHRGADLPAIAMSVLARLAPHRDLRLSPAALRVLRAFPWPGNVAQLERALTLALDRRPVGVIEAQDLPGFCHSEARAPMRHVDEVERDAIVDALRAEGGNRVAASERLGIARSTLYRKIKQYGLTV